jgi:hypothetical protein
VGRAPRLDQVQAYERDARWEDVVNQIVWWAMSDHAFIVAVETKQAMIQIMSYMEKAQINAVAVTDLDIGRFKRLTLQNAITCMAIGPRQNQVYVMNKGIAAVGWEVPPAYPLAWAKVNLLTTFEPREPWLTQFNGRLRRAA